MDSTIGQSTTAARMPLLSGPRARARSTPVRTFTTWIRRDVARLAKTALLVNAVAARRADWIPTGTRVRAGEGYDGAGVGVTIAVLRDVLVERVSSGRASAPGCAGAAVRPSHPRRSARAR